MTTETTTGGGRYEPQPPIAEASNQHNHEYDNLTSERQELHQEGSFWRRGRRGRCTKIRILGFIGLIWKRKLYEGISGWRPCGQGLGKAYHPLVGVGWGGRGCNLSTLVRIWYLIIRCPVLPPPLSNPTTRKNPRRGHLLLTHIEASILAYIPIQGYQDRFFCDSLVNFSPIYLQMTSFPSIMRAKVMAERVGGS